MLVFGPTRYAKKLHCGRVAVDIMFAVHGQIEQGCSLLGRYHGDLSFEAMTPAGMSQQHSLPHRCSRSQLGRSSCCWEVRAEAWGLRGHWEAAMMWRAFCTVLAGQVWLVCHLLMASVPA